ncbi:MAG TPA: DUF6600 domain-containing protein [Candidatus Dormibacteraeota bacterium]|nr:DUF6600 domain-containing protein [Candidatus Dormibacteraeota bacterium]
MASRSLLCRFSLLLAISAVALAPVWADSSHARIVRLSLVQGDVRFARDAHGADPLADSSVVWDAAQLNLPIRQGYIVATDNGRAEVEFENGAMAFLSENTVLEFYDLSLEDGGKTTRLVLRQGSASFHVNPGSGDYFSVTGGDFTVEATSRTEFRVDNFDDGSSVGVAKGRVSVVRKSGNTALSKGQSLSIKAGDDASLAVGRLADNDEFDRWVSGRIDSATTATNAALQYTSNSGYTSGYGDLTTYGSFSPIGGYGYGWRPYGVGFGWCPFDNGGWFFDSGFGWSFIGSQPWGWLPFHFGSWLFEPGLGWVWLPGAFGSGGFGLWRPSTGVWVRGRGGLLGVVPVHPLDAHGKTPLNLAHGVFPVDRGAVGAAIHPAGGGAEWKVLKTPPREALTSSLVRSAPPERLSRTLLAGPAGSRAVTVTRDSSIAYDAREHKFVNTNAPSGAANGETRSEKNAAATNVGVTARTGEPSGRTGTGTNAGTNTAGGNGSAVVVRTPTPPSSARGSNPPPPVRVMTPPPAPRSSGGERSGGYSGAGSAGSSRGSSGGGSVSHPSSSGAGSGSSSHPSSSGGGRPH